MCSRDWYILSLFSETVEAERALIRPSAGSWISVTFLSNLASRTSLFWIRFQKLAILNRPSNTIIRVAPCMYLFVTDSVSLDSTWAFRNFAYGSCYHWHSIMCLLSMTVYPSYFRNLPLEPTLWLLFETLWSDSISKPPWELELGNFLSMHALIQSRWWISSQHPSVLNFPKKKTSRFGSTLRDLHSHGGVINFLLGKVCNPILSLL